MAGFGRSAFGRGPFGRSDLGRDLIIELFPEAYLDESLEGAELGRDNQKDPLVQVLKTYSHAVNKRRLEIDGLKGLIDPETASPEVLQLLGKNLGLRIDKNDPEFLQRAFVATASQWLQIKGSKQGYLYRGLSQGFSVEIVNFWRVHESLTSSIPPRHRYYFRPKGHDQPVWLTGVLTAGSAVVTASNTLDSRFVGKDVIGPGIPSDTRVVSVSPSQIVLDKPTLVSGSSRVGVYPQNKQLHTDSSPGTHRGLAALFGDIRNRLTGAWVTVPSEFSIEMRFILNSTADQQLIENAPFGIWIINQKLVFTVAGQSVSSPVSALQEYYLVATCSSSGLKLFLNGEEVSSASEAMASYGDEQFSISTLVNAYRLKGRIWDVRITGRALAASEASSRLRSEYAVDADLLHRWTLNGSAQDSKGGSHLSFSYGPSYTEVVSLADQALYIEYPESSTYAKSAFLKLVFSVSRFDQGVDYNHLLDLVVEKLKDVAAIHHELVPPVYEVELSVAPQLSISSAAHEFMQVRAAVNNSFDLIPADTETADSGMSVTIAPRGGLLIPIDLNLDAVIDIA